MRTQTVDRFRRVTDLAAVAAAGLLLYRLYAIYACVGLRLNHDEAEHLHVAFALERGERPYLDFIENHPMLFNLGILVLKRAFPQDTVLGLYMLVRLGVFVAFAGCVYYAYRLCADYCQHEASPLRASRVFLMVFIFLGLLPEANSYLWDARPDWFCYLLSLMCVHAHYSVYGRSASGWSPRDFIALGIGGMAGGLATAVLPKSIYIFVPYALVACLVFGQRSRMLPADLGRVVAGNIVFVGIGILAFCSAVAGEIYTTGATLEAYYKANYVINRLPHHVGSLQDTPASQLATMIGGGVGSLLCIALASAILLFSMFRARRLFQFRTLVFACAIIGFNTLLLTSTNGAYWSHNFAPSLLAFLCIGFVLLQTILVWLVRAMEGRLGPQASNSAVVAPSALIGYGAMFLFMIVLGFSLAGRAGNAIRDHENLAFSRAFKKLTFDDQREDLLADRLLPVDLAYLVFNPGSMPLRARHWGYFFMLGPDKDFWRDNHNLGIGPDSQTYWRDLYATAPPDAILFSDISGDFFKVRERLLENQGVDISWLENSLRSDYICVARLGVAVHVRSERMAQFGDQGWKRCEA